MDQIDVGVIGAGAQANLVHYPSLAEIPYANIAAICDLDEKRLNKTADKYGVKLRFKDYKRMLDEVDLDAVYVIMAPQLLDPIVTYCLRKKKNIFIEKPAGISVEQNRRWAEEAEANGCITMVGYNRRFIPVVMEAKRIVEESGPITQCMVTFHKCTPEAIRMRKIKREPGTIGPYMGDVCHAIDLLRWAGGDVKEVFSYVSKHYSAETNTYNALLLFESGAIGILNTNRASGARVHSIEMHSKETWAFADLGRDVRRLNAIIAKKSDSPYEKAQIIESLALRGLGDFRGFPPFYKYYGYYHENLHFIRCILEKRQPQASFEDSVKTMELVMKIQSGTETPPIMERR